MFRYIITRMLAMIPTLIIASMLIFFIIELPPGDYFETYLARLQAAGETIDPAKLEYLRTEYGFDRPVWQRYLLWVGGMLQGDFGYSFEYERPVSELIGNRLFLTMLLSFVTIIFTWLRLPFRSAFTPPRINTAGGTTVSPFSACSVWRCRIFCSLW